jgi:hypothetical protein
LFGDVKNFLMCEGKVLNPTHPPWTLDSGIPVDDELVLVGAVDGLGDVVVGQSHHLTEEAHLTLPQEEGGPRSHTPATSSIKSSRNIIIFIDPTGEKKHKQTNIQTMFILE